MSVMANPKACFSKHSQWPPKIFRLAGLERECCFILPWMSETSFIFISIFILILSKVIWGIMESCHHFFVFSLAGNSPLKSLFGKILFLVEVLGVPVM